MSEMAAAGGKPGNKAAPPAAKPAPRPLPQFTKQQVAGRLRQLKYLFEQWLLTDEFYAAKVAECEAVAAAEDPAPTGGRR